MWASGRHDVARPGRPSREVPELLGVPGAAADRLLEVLVADPPAAVAALDHVDQPGLVAAVGVVVAR